MRYFLSLLLGISMISGSAFAADLRIIPHFADARFTPADQLHAGCVNTASVSIKTSANEHITSLRLIISYQPQDLQILNIKPTDIYKTALDSKIEYDKIVINLLENQIPAGTTTKLFDIVFKSTETVSGSVIAIIKPSFLASKTDAKIPVFVDQKLNFAKVPECEPDTLPPTITLVKPTNTDQILPIDAAFIFQIKDSGKGIDKNSLVLTFNGKTYSGEDSALSRVNDYVGFAPSNRLALGTGVSLSLSISDKQVYGGTNESTKIFSFKTTTGVAFDSNLTPTILRKLLGKGEKIYATTKECALLGQFISSKSDTSLVSFFQSITNKLGCQLDIEALITKTSLDTDKDKDQKFGPAARGISVFAVLGWLLFIVALLLKLHYFFALKSHKRRNME